MRKITVLFMLLLAQIVASAQSHPTLKGKILRSYITSVERPYLYFYISEDNKVQGLWYQDGREQRGLGSNSMAYSERLDPSDPNTLYPRFGDSEFSLKFENGQVINPIYYHVINRNRSTNRVNVSNRGYVQGDKTCIAGFTSANGGIYVIRAMGKSLQQFSVEATDEARFSLFWGQTKIGDSFPLVGDSYGNLLNLVGAFPPAADATESILVASLGRGIYTVVARGGAKPGDILVEVYELGFGEYRNPDESPATQ